MILHQRELVTIENITRYPMSFCTSRRMDVVVRTKEGAKITVPWAEVPAVATSSCLPTKPTHHFAYFWHNGTPGMVAVLLHGNDATYNFLKPI